MKTPEYFKSEEVDPSFTYVIFDLDGTLCNIDHRLHLIKCENPDYDKFNAQCVNDSLNGHIACIFDSLCGSIHPAFRSIIVTGRSESCRDSTKEWLSIRGINSDYLFMRPINDFRSDVDLKYDIYKSKIANARVLFTLEDRDRVVDMWRSLGLKCLQVEKGQY